MEYIPKILLKLQYEIEQYLSPLFYKLLLKRLLVVFYNVMSCVVSYYTSWCVWSEILSIHFPFGIKWRSKPLCLSLEPRSQAE